MVAAQVRSGRTPGGIVVLGDGPVPRAVAAWLSAHGHAVSALPALGLASDAGADVPPAAAGSVLAADPVATAGALVWFADGGDVAASWAIPADRRRAMVGEQARAVREIAAQGAGPAVVVVTSAMVHGASPERPVLHDDSPVLPPDDGPGVVADLLAVEAELAAGLAAGELAVLRPAPVVGPAVDTLITRHFEATRLLALRGVDRPWQLLHTDDLAAAVEAVLVHGLTGGLTVGAPDVLDPVAVQRRAGMRRVELPAATAFGVAERLHRIGVLPAPAAELAYAVYPWTVAADRLVALGWSAQWSTAACLDVLVDQVHGRLTLGGRRLGGRDAAALGAASAAVAAVGTAALVRRARSRG